MQSDAKFTLEKFASVARAFCEFLDKVTEIDRQAYLSALPIQLARICEAGASLPSVQLDSAECGDEEEILFNSAVAADPARTELRSYLRMRLRAVFGKADTYWVLFDPTVNEAPVQGSISDDLADIYLDLQEILAKISAGSDATEICFDAWLGFHAHWFRHAVNALKYSIVLLDLP